MRLALTEHTKTRPGRILARGKLLKKTGFLTKVEQNH